MNTEALYKSLAGSYEEVMSRLLTDERVKKYLKKFPQSPDYTDMCAAIESGNWEVAFRASHNIKGMSLNLALKELAKSSSELCEYFRHGAPTADYADALAHLKADYEKTVAAIAELE